MPSLCHHLGLVPRSSIKLQRSKRWSKLMKVQRNAAMVLNRSDLQRTNSQKVLSLFEDSRPSLQQSLSPSGSFPVELAISKELEYEVEKDQSLVKLREDTSSKNNHFRTRWPSASDLLNQPVPGESQRDKEHISLRPNSRRSQSVGRTRPSRQQSTGGPSRSMSLEQHANIPGLSISHRRLSLNGVQSSQFRRELSQMSFEQHQDYIRRMIQSIAQDSSSDSTTVPNSLVKSPQSQKLPQSELDLRFRTHHWKNPSKRDQIPSPQRLTSPEVILNQEKSRKSSKRQNWDRNVSVDRPSDQSYGRLSTRISRAANHSNNNTSEPGSNVTEYIGQTRGDTSTRFGEQAPSPRRRYSGERTSESKQRTTLRSEPERQSQRPDQTGTPSTPKERRRTNRSHSVVTTRRSTGRISQEGPQNEQLNRSQQHITSKETAESMVQGAPSTRESRVSSNGKRRPPSPLPKRIRTAHKSEGRIQQDKESQVSPAYARDRTASERKQDRQSKFDKQRTDKTPLTTENRPVTTSPSGSIQLSQLSPGGGALRLASPIERRRVARSQSPSLSQRVRPLAGVIPVDRETTNKINPEGEREKKINIRSQSLDRRHRNNRSKTQNGKELKFGQSNQTGERRAITTPERRRFGRSQSPVAPLVLSNANSTDEALRSRSRDRIRQSSRSNDGSRCRRASQSSEQQGVPPMSTPPGKPKHGYQESRKRRSLSVDRRKLDRSQSPRTKQQATFPSSDEFLRGGHVAPKQNMKAPKGSVNTKQTDAPNNARTRSSQSSPEKKRHSNSRSVSDGRQHRKLQVRSRSQTPKKNTDAGITTPSQQGHSTKDMPEKFLSPPLPRKKKDDKSRSKSTVPHVNGHRRSRSKVSVHKGDSQRNVPSSPQDQIAAVHSNSNLKLKRAISQHFTHSPEDNAELMPPPGDLSLGDTWPQWLSDSSGWLNVPLTASQSRMSSTGEQSWGSFGRRDDPRALEACPEQTVTMDKHTGSILSETTQSESCSMKITYISTPSSDMVSKTSQQLSKKSNHVDRVQRLRVRSWRGIMASAGQLQGAVKTMTIGLVSPISRRRGKHSDMEQSSTSSSPLDLSAFDCAKSEEMKIDVNNTEKAVPDRNAERRKLVTKENGEATMPIRKQRERGRASVIIQKWVRRYLVMLHREAMAVQFRQVDAIITIQSMIRGLLAQLRANKLRQSLLHQRVIAIVVVQSSVRMFLARRRCSRWRQLREDALQRELAKYKPQMKKYLDFVAKKRLAKTQNLRQLETMEEKFVEIEAEVEFECKKLNDRKQMQKRIWEGVIRRSLEQDFEAQSHATLLQPENEVNSAEDEILQLEHENKEMRDWLEKTKAKVEKRSEEIDSLQKANDEVETMFNALNEYARKQVTEKKELSSQQLMMTKFLIPKVEREIEACQRESMIEIRSKTLHRKNLYKVLFRVEESGEDNELLCKDIKETIRECESSLGQVLLHGETLQELVQGDLKGLVKRQELEQEAKHTPMLTGSKGWQVLVKDVLAANASQNTAVR